MYFTNDNYMSDMEEGQSVMEMSYGWSETRVTYDLGDKDKVEEEYQEQTSNDSLSDIEVTIKYEKSIPELNCDNEMHQQHQQAQKKQQREKQSKISDFIIDGRS
eukprot:5107711-Ditylum_brightwellii.AAC.1